MAWVPAAIAAGGALLSGSLAERGASARNISQIAQSAEQMKFQERLSSTAHQRQVKDMRAAGLNPILSATGGSGASSPGGAQAQIQDEIAPALSSAFQAMKTFQELRNMRATEFQTLAQTALTGAQTDVIAPAATVGSALNEGMSSVRGMTSSGGLLDGFKRMVTEALRGGTSAARQAERDRFRDTPSLNLRNLQVFPPRNRIGGK